MNEQDKRSYDQILKSTGIIGGSQVINIAIGIIRTKIVALLLGPMGYGIVSSLQATIDMMRQATGFGLNFSAVREISQNIEDAHSVGRVLTILRRWALVTGLLGTLITILLCYPLSLYAFDNSHYTLSIASVSIVLLLTSISSAKNAELQGLRLLKKMAFASIWGAVVGTIIVIPLYYLWGIDGIVPALILTALAALVISWWYTRRINIERVPLTMKQTFIGGLSMAKLGLFIVATGFIVTLIMYTIRAFIVRELSLDAVGWFQSAFSVANIYIGIILTAMGADFFPRLSVVHDNNIESNILINQQLEMVLLIISPILIGMIGASRLVINILYSSEFSQAIPLLQWQLAGGILTVIAWCLGVMFLAKNKGHLSLISEIIWGVIYLGLVVILWQYWGFISLGIAYVIACLIKVVIVVLMTKRIGQFSFSKPAIKDILLFSLLTTLILANVNLMDGIIQYAISFTLFILTVLYCYKRLSSVVDWKNIIKKILKK